MLWEQLSVFCHWLSLFVQWHSPSLSEIVEMLEFLCPRSVCRRALAHFSVCDSSWVTQYDCNRNGNRAEMLRVCTVRPLSPTLRGSKGGVSSNLIGSNVLAGCWLGSYFSRIARGRRGKTGFLQMKPGIVVGMPNQLLSQCFGSVFFLEDCERERKNWIFSDETFFYI